MIGLLLSGVGRKVAIAGAAALAVLLVVCGIYRAGGKAAEAAGTKRALERTIRNVRARQETETAISRDNAAGRRSVDRLRNEWSRD